MSDLKHRSSYESMVLDNYHPDLHAELRVEVQGDGYLSLINLDNHEGLEISVEALQKILDWYHGKH